MLNKTPSCIEQLGLATEFCTRGIDSEDSIPKLGTERNDMNKWVFTKNPAPSNSIHSVFSSRYAS
jgi:hypothetical protein